MTMTMTTPPPRDPPRPSSVYGPVQSWRLGNSLGIDPILSSHACSFHCIYCQLGSQAATTMTRDSFISLEWLLSDLDKFCPWDVDNLTFAGSGEPTLANNLGTLIAGAKKKTNRPAVVLTNASLLHQAEVRRDLAEADLVCCKLDAANPASFAKINRPHQDISFLDIFRGIHALSKEMPGRVKLQVMVSPMNIGDLHQMAPWIPLLGNIKVDLTSPSRPVPANWQLENRQGGTMGGMIRPVGQQDMVDLKTLLEKSGSQEVRVPPDFRGL